MLNFELEVTKGEPIESWFLLDALATWCRRYSQARWHELQAVTMSTHPSDGASVSVFTPLLIFQI